jgi:thioredoxin-like negative regulator of GroEL
MSNLHPHQPPWRPASPPVEAGWFADIIEGRGTIIHFWAPWNPHDKPLDAHLRQLAPIWQKRFQFFAANADDTSFSEIIERYHVAAFPALLCFVNGRVKGRFYGVETLEKVEAFLKEMAEP